MRRQDAESETLIPTIGGVFDVGITLLGGGHSNNPLDENIVQIPFDTTQITSPKNGSNPQPGDASHALTAGAHAPAIAFTVQAGALRQNPTSSPDGVGVQADVAYTLEARAEVQAVVFARDVAQTITSNSGKQLDNSDTALGPNIIAVHGTQDPDTLIEQAHTLGRNQGQENVIAQPYTLAIRGRGDSHKLEFRQDGTANALLTPNGGRAGIGVGAIGYGVQVRRLTPRECERLQGFPDDYTRIEWRGRPAQQCPDGPRYKALGNSMAVPVMRWIGQRIDAAAKFGNYHAASAMQTAIIGTGEQLHELGAKNDKTRTSCRRRNGEWQENHQPQAASGEGAAV